MIRIKDGNALADFDVQERFIRTTAPGSHHLTKAASAVQLRVKIDALPVPLDVRLRLTDLAGRHVTNRGVLIVESRAHRSQQENREAARARLLDLLERAWTPPPQRRATRPNGAAREGRMADKKRLGVKKMSRHGGPNRDE